MPNKGTRKYTACEYCGISSFQTRVSYVSLADMVLCAKHHQQFLRNGFLLKETMYDKNNINIYEDHAEIELKDKKQNTVGFAIIDLDDVDKCKNYKWCARRPKGSKTIYAATRVENKITFLHRFVMNFNGENNMFIDHKNRNGLDNRKSNLHIVTHSENMINIERHGCQRRTKNGRYIASFTRNKRRFYFGDYETIEEALNEKSLQLQKYEQDIPLFIKQYEEKNAKRHKKAI